MLRQGLFTIALLFCALVWRPAAAESVVLGLNQDQVSITADFHGSELLIFGAIRRDTPLQEDPLQVALTVSGPVEPVTVRRKSRVAGIWINTDRQDIGAAPSFYAVATSGYWTETVSPDLDNRHHLSIGQAIYPQDNEEAENSEFQDALIRIRQQDGQYQLLENQISLQQQTLFEANIDLPSNLVEGSYPIRVFLTRNGDLVSEYRTNIQVRKVGLERFLHSTAHETPLLYGIMSLAIALFAGWLASSLFAMIRRQ